MPSRSRPSRKEHRMHKGPVRGMAFSAAAPSAPVLPSDPPTARASGVSRESSIGHGARHQAAAPRGSGDAPPGPQRSGAAVAGRRGYDPAMQYDGVQLTSRTSGPIAP